MSLDDINGQMQRLHDQENLQQRYWDDCSLWGHRLIEVAGNARAPLAELELWVNQVGEFLTPHQIELMIKRRAAKKQQWLLKAVTVDGVQVAFAEGLLTWLEESTSEYMKRERSDLKSEREIMSFRLWMKKSLLFMMKQYVYARSSSAIKAYK